MKHQQFKNYTYTTLTLLGFLLSPHTFAAGEDEGKEIEQPKVVNQEEVNHLESLPDELQLYELYVLAETDVKALGRMCATSHKFNTWIMSDKVLRKTVKGAQLIHKLTEEIKSKGESLTSQDITRINSDLLMFFGVIPPAEENPFIDYRCYKAEKFLHDETRKFVKLLLAQVPCIMDRIRISYFAALSPGAPSHWTTDDRPAFEVILSNPYLLETDYKEFIAMIKGHLDSAQNGSADWLAIPLTSIGQNIPETLLEEVLTLRQQFAQLVFNVHRNEGNHTWGGLVRNGKIPFDLMVSRVLQPMKSDPEWAMDLRDIAMSGIAPSQELDDEWFEEALSYADMVFRGNHPTQISNPKSLAFQIWRLLAGNEKLSEEKRIKVYNIIEEKFNEVLSVQEDEAVKKDDYYDRITSFAYNRRTPTYILDSLYELVQESELPDKGVSPEKLVKILSLAFLHHPNASEELKAKILAKFPELAPVDEVEENSEGVEGKKREKEIEEDKGS